MSFATCLAVMAGGAVGSLMRYVLAALAAPLSRSLPVGTIAINIGGSFLIAFFGTLTLAQGRYPAPEWLRVLVMVGVCGGFTTFSSFSLQTFDLMRSGAMMRAGLNIVLSVALCLGATALGHLAASKMNGGLRQVAQADIEEEV